MRDTKADNVKTEEKREDRRYEQQANREEHVMPLTGVVRHRSSRRPSRRSSLSTNVEGSTDSDHVDHPQSTAIEPTDSVELALGAFRAVEWPNGDLNGRDAHGADFRAANLNGISALGTNFADSSFETAQMQGAALCGANLTGANLRHVNLRNANLAWTDLRGATLCGADLRNANLAWADLRHVDLREADLTGAIYNYQTKWPIDFDPRAQALLEIAEPR